MEVDIKIDKDGSRKLKTCVGGRRREATTHVNGCWMMVKIMNESRNGRKIMGLL